MRSTILSHIHIFYITLQGIMWYTSSLLIIRVGKFKYIIMQEDQDDLRAKLTEYRVEHQALDELIEKVTQTDQPVNLLHMQQLKKKKLWLKDVIQKIESSLIDDIIA